MNTFDAPTQLAWSSNDDQIYHKNLWVQGSKKLVPLEDELNRLRHYHQPPGYKNDFRVPSIIDPLDKLILIKCRLIMKAYLYNGDEQHLGTTLSAIEDLLTAEVPDLSHANRVVRFMKIKKQISLSIAAEPSSDTDEFDLDCSL